MLERLSFERAFINLIMLSVKSLSYSVLEISDSDNDGRDGRGLAFVIFSAGSVVRPAP